MPQVYSISVEVQLQGGDREPGDPLIPIAANISVAQGDKGYDKVVGHIQGTLIPSSCRGQRVDMLLAADDESQDLYELVQTVSNGTHWHVGNDLCLDHITGGLLCLETANIDPEYRGFNIAPVAGSELIDILGCCVGLVVTRPHPILDELHPITDEAIATAIQKIAKHWEQVGFVENPLHPGYMYLDPTLRRPYPLLKCGLTTDK